MAWICVEEGGIEGIFPSKPKREKYYWSIDWYLDVICSECDYSFLEQYDPSVKLPKGTIKKLIGYELKWEDEPVELK